MSDPVETLLASTFRGLNRILAETELGEEFSPDTTDARNTDRKLGQLGPRLGRQRHSTATYPLLGLGMLVAPFGRFKLLADTNGDWTASAVAWAGVTPGTPTTATATAVNQDGSSKMDLGAGVRFVQYGTRVIAYNGRNRPLTFDGNKWRNLGIIGGVDFLAQFTPTVSLGSGGKFVSTAVLNTNVATFTTTTAHGFTTGQIVTVALTTGDTTYNGAWTVASTPSTTTFTVAIIHANIASSLVTGTATGSLGTRGTSKAVTLTNVTTITTIGAHGFVTGQSATFTDAIYPYFSANSPFVITVVTSTTFTIPTVGVPDGTAYDLSGGQSGMGVYVGASLLPAGITGTYYYYVVAASSTKLDINGRMVEGIPSNPSAAASPVAQAVTISGIPTTHIDPQVDKWNIYRTLNGGYDSAVVPQQQDFFLLTTIALAAGSYTDTTADSSLWYQLADTSNRLRFNQNISPTFKMAAVYGERVFAAGFDPITSSTVTTASSATVTLATGTWPEGVKGCYFRQNGDDGIYEIKARPSTTTITLDRTFTGTTGATKSYTIYRNPNEIWFSEFQSPDAWGPDGEFKRNKLVLPGDKAVTGLFPFQGSLLVFTATEIWVIYGKGPNRFDVKKLTDAACVDAGAVSQDTIFRSGNECHFLSLDGPASISSVGTSIDVKFYGVNLNVDWLDTLTAAETALACAGTDGRAIWYSVPSAAGQTLNSKTFRFERDTEGWFEETEMCPTRFIRQDGTDGQIQALFYLQDRFVIRPQTGTLDLVSAALSGTIYGSTGLTIDTSRQIVQAVLFGNTAALFTTDPHGLQVGDTVVVNISDATYNGTFVISAVPTPTAFDYVLVNSSIGLASVTGTAYIQHTFPTSNGGLEQNYIRFYKGAVNYGAADAGKPLATRRIISNTEYSVTFSSTSTLPGSGTNFFLAGDTFEIGNIGWKWLTKTAFIPAHRELAQDVHVAFNKDAAATILHTDVIDDVETTNIGTVSCANKVASKFAVMGANTTYSVRLGSRTGAVLQNALLSSLVEADSV